MACRVRDLSTQGYYKWLKQPVSQRDWDEAHAIDALIELHIEDPTLGYWFLAEELADVGIGAPENRMWRLCSIIGAFVSYHRKPARAKKPGPPVHRSTTTSSRTSTTTT